MDAHRGQKTKYVSKNIPKDIRKTLCNLARRSYRDSRTGRFIKKPERVIHILMGVGAYHAFKQIMDMEAISKISTKQKGS